MCHVISGWMCLSKIWAPKVLPIFGKLSSVILAEISWNIVLKKCICFIIRGRMFSVCWIVLTWREVAHRLPGGTATSPQGQPAATPRQSQGAQQEANGDTSERPSPPRTVIVKFTSRRTKSRVMALRKELKELNRSPENTDPAIYFQDDLTAPRAKLAYQARVLKREKCVADTWVIDSKIYVKICITALNSWSHRVTLRNSRNNDDLSKFKKKYIVFWRLTT